MRGLILGKFLPPHCGHQYLIDFAAEYAGHVTVHVCTLPTDPIPGALRYQWMREQFHGRRDVTIIHCEDIVPQTPEEDPEHFWDIWRTTLLKRMDGPPDLVFASEPYGFPLAETLGARYVPVDHARAQVPVSGTHLREDPLRYWKYLIPPARPYFIKRIALVGPESSGKSTLTERLAARYGAVFASEYARSYLDTVPAHWISPEGENGFDAAALEAILRGQRASVEAMARQSTNGILFSDTEAIVTSVWADVLLGSIPPLADAFVRSQKYDLYLLMAETESWVQDDSQRVQPDIAERRRFSLACQARLDAHGYPYVRLTGNWDEREQQAVAAVDGLLR